MSIFTDAQLISLAQEAETNLAAEHTILAREFIDVKKGINSYPLPDKFLAISRVSWRGKKMYPSTLKDQIRYGAPFGQGTQSEPRGYILNSYGSNTIKIVPTPSSDTPIPDADPWEMEGIRNGYIVEYYTDPDFDTDDVRIPSFIRRQVVKYFVNFRALRKESKAMDLKASAYFQSLYEEYKTLFIKLHSNIFESIRRVMSGNPSRALYISRLPAQFGVKVDLYE